VLILSHFHQGMEGRDIFRFGFFQDGTVILEILRQTLISAVVRVEMRPHLIDSYHIDWSHLRCLDLQRIQSWRR
jgi:hypothetical protein